MHSKPDLWYCLNDSSFKVIFWQRVGTLMMTIIPKIYQASTQISAVDMAQTGEGAYFRIILCATCLEYKPLPADGFAYHLFSAY